MAKIVIGDTPPPNIRIAQLEAEIEKLNKVIDQLNEEKKQAENYAKKLKNQTKSNPELEEEKAKNENLQKEIEKLEKEVQTLANDKAKLENKESEKWDWNKFFIGLSKFGITESTIISIVLLALTQAIEYLEVLELGENTGWVVFSSLLIIVLKSTKQILKENNKKIKEENTK